MHPPFLIRQALNLGVEHRDLDYDYKYNFYYDALTRLSRLLAL